MLSKSDKMLDSFIDDELLLLEQSGLKRRLRLVQGAQGKRITLDGRQVLNFCSNNYLGLADDGRLKAAAVKAIDEEGWGSGASRLICGNLTAHQALEKKLSQFKGTESALTFSTGYMANIGIISALFGREDMILSDKLNHASIIDGILLSQAQYRRYPHNDMKALEAMLQSATGFKKRVIMTDSVFSMDGDIAPLDTIVGLAEKYNCSVMIDEAHAFGVMGANGKGLAEHFGVQEKIDIQMGTLSKAAGSFGAYVCGSQKLMDYLINHARSFIYTTGMPPAMAAASVQAIDIIVSEPLLRARLWQNTDYMREALKKIGFNTMQTQTPIIPILVKDSKLAVRFAEGLLEKGIFVSAIRPPTVPADTARLRLTVTAAHTRADMDCALEHLRETAKKLCLI